MYNTRFSDKLLFNEQPLVISREIARFIGLNEAIVIQQVHYWLYINQQQNRNYINNRYWTYNSIRQWHETNFDFWSYDTVKRTFAKLEKEGYLITGIFNKEARDKTKWYTIDYDKIEEKYNANISNDSLGQNAPMVRAKCPNGLGQNAPMVRAKCPNELGQNATMDWGKMPQPLPENNTKNNTKNTAKTTNQQNKKSKNEDWLNKSNEFDMYIDYIKIEKNINIDSVSKYAIIENEQLEEIIRIMAEMYIDDETIINKSLKPKSIIHSVLKKIKPINVAYVINSFNNNSENIVYPKNYIKTMLYNSVFQAGNNYKNDFKYATGLDIEIR